RRASQTGPRQRSHRRGLEEAGGKIGVCGRGADFTGMPNKVVERYATNAAPLTTDVETVEKVSN
ncbi:MAG: hypothetical protein WCS01_10935, partial [bacterium]